MISLLQGDCLDRMNEIPDGSVDMVLCDLPYGTTIHKNAQGTPTAAWDTPIPFENLWAQYRRLIKPTGNIILTAAQPFTSRLVTSNVEWFKYTLVWRKSRVSGHFSVQYRPLVEHEDICVFTPGGVAMNSKFPATYNPEGMTQIAPKPRTGRKKTSATARTIHEGKGVQTQTGYPRSIIEIASESRGVHPTQKPVDLMRYLMRLFSNPGETVLDNTMGSGSTAVAAIREGRSFIGIEMDESYFQIAKERVESEMISDYWGGL